MTKEKKDGPTIRVEARCDGCRFHSSEYFCYPDGDEDWGYDYYCSHPGAQISSDQQRRVIYSSTTPDWCPFLPLHYQVAVK
jgi:hypothetical protein